MTSHATAAHRAAGRDSHTSTKLIVQGQNVRIDSRLGPAEPEPGDTPMTTTLHTTDVHSSSGRSAIISEGFVVADYRPNAQSASTLAA